jgi:hypothetical protein
MACVRDNTREFIRTSRNRSVDYQTECTRSHYAGLELARGALAVGETSNCNGMSIEHLDACFCSCCFFLGT